MNMDEMWAISTALQVAILVVLIAIFLRLKK